MICNIMKKFLRKCICKMGLHKKIFIRKASYSRTTPSAEGCMEGYVIFHKCDCCNRGIIDLSLAHWVDGKIEVELGEDFYKEAYATRGYGYGYDPPYGDAKILRRYGRF